jgi:hypothetical protein
MRNAVLHTDSPVVFRPRRFTDPVSQINEDIHDATRALATAVEMIDHLGLTILSVDADLTRNRRIVVAHSRECAALDGVEIARHPGWSVWSANRYGVEIRWHIPMEAA